MNRKQNLSCNLCLCGLECSYSHSNVVFCWTVWELYPMPKDLWKRISLFFANQKCRMRYILSKGCAIGWRQTLNYITSSHYSSHHTATHLVTSFITSRHTTLHHIIPRHVTTHNTSHHMASRHITNTSHNIKLRNSLYYQQHHIMSHIITVHFTQLQNKTLPNITTRHVVHRRITSHITTHHGAHHVTPHQS